MKLSQNGDQTFTLFDEEGVQRTVIDWEQILDLHAEIHRLFKVYPEVPAAPEYYSEQPI